MLKSTPGSSQIPDVFLYNERLVIADGTEARMGSLSADAERFMQWRTIDGVTIDPLGQFNELETLIRGACWLPVGYWTTCATASCLRTMGD